ncbi:MAG: gliding motility-associated C-terminal domain-containing protein [Armatimonadetes bacterium]|nr:gliding motility-associated C-terminal domain-containing protein [Armatimonadota bacterium]
MRHITPFLPTMITELRKSNFNNARGVFVSNFKLDICTSSFKVVVAANDETQARQRAEQICNIITKNPPRPASVSVVLRGEGPPFKRGKPVRVVATVSGDGNLEVSSVVATFSNGDSPILLNATGPTTFEGIWKPTKILAGAQTDQQGNLIFPVTVTVIASGCGQTATGSAETQVKIGGIQITVTKPQPEEGFRVDWSPGGETSVMISGKVTDDEGNGIPSTVEVEYWFTRLGNDVPSVRSERKDTSPQGSFAFVFTTNFPGNLLVKIFATAKDDRRLKAFKRIEGIIRAQLQLQVSKDGYKFLRGTMNGQKLNEQPININAEDVKEVKVKVFGLQPNSDNPPQLEWKPLQGATVEVLGGGSVTTNRNGEVILPVNSRAQTIVEIQVDMKPELEIKIASIPKAFIARPDAQGQIAVYLGKNLSEPTYPQPNNPQIRADYLLTGRQFRVTVSQGGLTNNIAKPSESNPTAHIVNYQPPQSLEVGFIEVTVVAEDITEGTDEPLYRGETKFRVFRDAFLTFHKEGFEDPEPRKVDLVEQDSLRVLPGIIEGFLVAEQPGRPIIGANVSLVYPEIQQNTITQGRYQPPQNAEVQQDAGKFRFEIDANRPTWSLTDPVRVQFIPEVRELGRKISTRIALLGYRVPDFNERLGFGNVFPFRWELRYQTDQERVRKTIEAVQRLDAFSDLVETAHPLLKEYAKETVGAVVDLTLSLVGGKIFQLLSKRFKLGEGIGVSNFQREFMWRKLRDEIRVPPSALPYVYGSVISDAIIRNKGITDKAIEEVYFSLKASQVVNLTDEQIEEIVRMLQDYREAVYDAAKSMTESIVKGDLLGWVKSALNVLGFNTSVKIQTGSETIDNWLNEIIDKVLDFVLGKITEALLSGSELSFEPIFGLSDQIAEILIAPYRTSTQNQINEQMQKFGQYQFQGNTPSLINSIRQQKEKILSERQLYEIGRSPLSSIARAILESFKDHQEILTGKQNLFKGSAGVAAEFFESLLPIKSAATVILAPLAFVTAWSRQVMAHHDALGIPIAEPYDPDLDYANQYLRTVGRLRPVPNRNRQLSEYTEVVNQVKEALQQQNMENLINLIRPLSQVSLSINEALRAKETVILTAVPIAYRVDRNYPSEARQVSESIDRSDASRRLLLLRLGSVIAAEDDNAVIEAYNTADEAIQKTSEAMGLVESAIQRLMSLGINIPAILYADYQSEQLSLTEWRLTFTVTNLGDQTSPPVLVKFIPSEGVHVSQTSWSLQPLPSKASQSVTITARLPVRVGAGLGFVRTTLSEFKVAFVPTIAIITSEDSLPPLITDLMPSENGLVRTRNPIISAKISDSISGIDVDTIKMRLDGQQVNANYDIATNKLTYRSQDLSEGEHTVVIEVSDLEGNVARMEWRFFVNLSTPVEITNLQVSPNPFSPNGDDLDETLTIRFRINANINLAVEVIDEAGKLVKTLVNESPFDQGEHTLIWDGTNNAGEPVPEGNYSVKITVLDTNRQQTFEQGQIILIRNPLSITNVSISTNSMRLTKQPTIISFNISRDATVRVKVYSGENTDDEGFVVRTLTINALRGTNSVSWDGRTDEGQFVTSGVYSIVIEADAVTLVSRLPSVGRVQVQSLPDLLPATVATEEQNSQTKLTVTVRNIGGEPARNVLIRFLHQGNLIGNATIAEILAGSEATAEILWDPHRGLLTRDIEVIADPDEQIDELEEFNNRLQMSVEVAPMRIAHLLPEGVSLVSVPIQLLDPTPQNVFGFASPEETKVAWWDPQKEGNVKYRFANEIPAIEPGKGYFVKLPSERLMQWAGAPLRTQNGEPLVINLQAGWNLIGLPRLGSVALGDVKVKRPNDNTASAINFAQPGNPLIEPYAWTYSNSERRYQLVYPDLGELGTFDAFKGYWVFAKEPCQLLIPAQSRSVYVARKRNQIEGWFFRVEALAGEFTDSIVVGRNSTRLQAQKPPISPDGQLVRLSILDDQGRSWGALVSDGNGRMTFKLLLEAERSVEKVTLRFPDLGYLPKGFGVYLIDEETGQRRYLRTTAAVTINMKPNRGESERKVLKLAIVPEGTGLLRIVGLKAEPMRGRGVAVQFALTRPAQTQIEVLTLTGRRVAVLESGQSRSTGRHQVVWQGRNGDGQVLPTSTYIVRVVATDDEGRQVQATTVARLR